MRTLFDECVPAKLKNFFPEHDCRTVADMKRRGLRNGELLAAAEEQRDVLLTADRGYEHQQSLCRECLKSISPGIVIRVPQP